jgi:PIN domain nuclease of toxin-antitoxin system
MSRSLAELVALVADTNLDPFDRMCHAASLTNQAHAATA